MTNGEQADGYCSACSGWMDALDGEQSSKQTGPDENGSDEQKVSPMKTDPALCFCILCCCWWKKEELVPLLLRVSSPSCCNSIPLTSFFEGQACIQFAH